MTVLTIYGTKGQMLSEQIFVRVPDKGFLATGLTIMSTGVADHLEVFSQTGRRRYTLGTLGSSDIPIPSINLCIGDTVTFSLHRGLLCSS